jgi:hypothetical protein
MSIASSLCILLLDPNFTRVDGGMENPCLTFVTPTLLAGDRSLANVVAHEIAHSWMGNLVTSETWEVHACLSLQESVLHALNAHLLHVQHFWMNEGFTVFLERKIIAKMFGEDVFHLHVRTRAFRCTIPLTFLPSCNSSREGYHGLEEPARLCEPFRRKRRVHQAESRPPRC